LLTLLVKHRAGNDEITLFFNALFTLTVSGWWHRLSTSSSTTLRVS